MMHQRATGATALDRPGSSCAGPSAAFDATTIEPMPVSSRWPVYEADEIEAVVEVLRSGKVNGLVHGTLCGAFEKAFARRFEMPYAIAMANGTLALELALRTLGIGPGDEVIVPARSFIASASCVAAVGATPIFADVDEQSQGVTAATVSAALSSRTRAVLVVHLAGWPCAVDDIESLARTHGLKLVEDCAQAHGAAINGRPAGSFGDAAAFSFCTDKIMSTGGEGGMLLLRDEAAWHRAWSYKDHGKDPLLVRQSGSGAFRWLHASLGSNYRMTELQAAIGLRQLGKLEGWLEARRQRAAALDRHFGALAAVRLTVPAASVRHAYYKYYAFLRPDRLRPGWDRDRIVQEAVAAGIPCGSGTCPEIYREKAFEGTPSAPLSPLPVSRMLGETSLMLPIDHTLSEAAIEQMAQVLVRIVEGATLN